MMNKCLYYYKMNIYIDQKALIDLEVSFADLLGKLK